jgi:hypothetical protein
MSLITNITFGIILEDHKIKIFMLHPSIKNIRSSANTKNSNKAKQLSPLKNCLYLIDP